MQQRIETIILKNLLHNEEYSRKVLPFLNKEYFIEHTDKILYEQVNAFINTEGYYKAAELFEEPANVELLIREIEKLEDDLTHAEG